MATDPESATGADTTAVRDPGPGMAPGGGPGGPTSSGDMDRPARAAPGAAVWLPLVLLLLLAGGTLAWLLVPGTRLFPPDTPAMADVAEAERVARALNDSLIARRAALQAALDGAQCRADGTLVLPDGRTMEGLLPPRPGAPDAGPGSPAPASPTPTLPAPVERTVPPGGPPGGTDSDGASLIDLIEARTVMVVARGGAVRTGSGFLVAPDLVVTNHHVVEAAGPGGVFVTNTRLGSLRPAEVLTTRGPFATVGADFALLRIAGAAEPFFDLLVSPDTLKLQAVIAAGYPGDILASDAAFAALRAGDAAAVPDLTVTDGLVSTEQTVGTGTRLVIHSAPISVGNSGGPLIDYCGRVVGVNTFVRTGPMRNLNFALGAADLVAFLGSAGVQPTVVTQGCDPVVRRPTVPPRGTGDPGAVASADASGDGAGDGADAAPGALPALPTLPATPVAPEDAPGEAPPAGGAP